MLNTDIVGEIRYDGEIVYIVVGNRYSKMFLNITYIDYEDTIYRYPRHLSAINLDQAVPRDRYD